jgi:hypothetical protein
MQRVWCCNLLEGRGGVVGLSLSVAHCPRRRLDDTSGSGTRPVRVYDPTLYPDMAPKVQGPDPSCVGSK